METLSGTAAFLDVVTAILGVPLVAGAIGGALRWWHLREAPAQGAGSVLTGAFVGHYFWILTGKWIDGYAEFSQIDPAAARGAGAFFIGTIAVWVLMWFIDFGRRKTELKKET